MVKGVARFREFFRDHADSFVVIGGVACEEWLGSKGLSFRPTKDIDMVLIVEALDEAFAEQFWAFIRAGKYQNRRKSSGKRIYYRFSKPAEPDFPETIEIFSRQPKNIDLAEGQEVVPIKTDDALSSLSAILMDEDYYRLVLAHREIIDGLPVVTATALIPLKARAWIDLTRRREEGERVDANDINKHRKDVFRLAAVLPNMSGPEIPGPIRADLVKFMAAFPRESTEWDDIRRSLKNQLGAATPEPEEFLEALNIFFGLGLRAPTSPEPPNA